MTGSEIDGSRGFKSSPLHQPVRFCGAPQCHGPDGTGNGPVATALKKKPANLTLLAKKNGGVFPEEQVREYIDGRKTVATHGTRKMPIWENEFMSRRAGSGGPGAPQLTEPQVQQKIGLLPVYQVNSVEVIRQPPKDLMSAGPPQPTGLNWKLERCFGMFAPRRGTQLVLLRVSDATRQAQRARRSSNELKPQQC
jgi:hypothetical protein